MAFTNICSIHDARLSVNWLLIPFHITLFDPEYDPDAPNMGKSIERINIGAY
jgi:hypothetical protein